MLLIIDVGFCIGASFAVGTFEEMLAHLKLAVKPGGILAMGDIYAKTESMPEQSAKHFAGGKQRSLADTAEMLNKDGLTLIGIIDSSDDDWDRYESLHWFVADRWLRENPDHNERDEFHQLNEQWKHDHIKYDRPTLGWGLFICRVNNSW